jgi:trans-aconitate 2-methyltransferase
MPWDPQQYHKFQAERFAPFDDLVRLVTVRPGLRVVDLGCGTGELTRRLADMLPESDVLGLDSSTVAGEWDLVFSHAAIQWVDDHEALVPRLFGLVRSGGQLAVQQPNNHTHPAHRAIFEIAGQEPFRTALDGWSRAWPQLPLERYAALLFEHGAENITVLEKVYPHVLADSDAVAEWTRGTALVPYLERLSSNMREAFLDAYRARLRAVLPGSPVFYGFRRMLVVAARPA